MMSDNAVSLSAQVRAVYAQLPQKWRRSVVGMAYGAVLDLLDEEGLVSQGAVLEALLPDMKPAQARLMLMTQYINRPYQTEQGSVPLRLQMSRASKKATQPAQLWFVAEQGFDPALATPRSERYQDSLFEDIQAQQATGQELLEAAKQVSQGLQQAPALHEAAPEPMRVAEDEAPMLRQARYEIQLGQYPEKRTHHGLRDAVKLKEWQDTQASAHDLRQSSAGKTVNCLQAMLEWTQNAATANEAPKLLVLLGDYGTGKTSHALQYSRVLNAEVPHAAWPLGDKAPKPRALYMDLAQMAGISELARLSLHDMLSLMLAKQLGRPTSSADVDALITQARTGELVMVYDGLDELLGNDRQVLHNVFGQLLKILEPATRPRAAGRQESQTTQARLIISCRTHYFRDVEQQHAFFDTRKRGIAKGEDYLCLTLLPWSPENVQSYLRKRLPAHQAQELARIIETTYNLQELASRPVLLAMMSEQVGSLLRQAELGEPITAAQLYNITVAEWIARDDGKHRIAAFHKPLLMGALAAALWSDETESWSTPRLDAWVMQTLNQLFPGEYSAAQAQALQDDLRTATFIVRPGSDDFSFAHRSFAEYFLARFVLDAMEACCAGWLSPAVLRPLLPQRALNLESMNFLKELWDQVLSKPVMQGAMRTACSAAQLAMPLWQWLQEGGDARIMQDATLLDVPYQSAPALHASLWGMAVALKLPAPDLAGAAAHLNWQPLKPINLRGLQFVGEQWQGVDWRGLPPLDCRGTNFLALRAHGCLLGRVICNKHTNWAQALLRDCDTALVAWGDSDRAGLRVRQGDIWKRWPERQAGRMVLQGPWRRVMQRSGMNAVAFSPDGRSVLTGSHDGSAYIWDAASGQILREFKGHGDAVSSVAFSPDGCSVLTGSYDGSARFWDAASGQMQQECIGHGDEVSSVAFSPDGRSAITGSWDKTACLWATASGKLQREFIGHGNSVTSVAFSPDNCSVLTGSRDKTAHLWDAASGKLQREFKGHVKAVTSVAFSPDGRSVLTGSDDKTARLWDTASGQMQGKFKGHRGIVSSVTFSSDGQSVLTGSYDATACLWNLASGQVQREFNGHRGSVTSVAFSIDGRRVLTGSYDGAARSWDDASSQQHREFKGHGVWVASVAFSPSGRSVLTGSYDGTARLWDSDSSQMQCEFKGLGRLVTFVAFSPDGRSVLTASTDDATRQWDVASGQMQREFKEHGIVATSAVFSPDGRSVLAGNFHSTARLWDTASGQLRLEFKGHGSTVTSVGFSPDGRSVLTGSSDKTACLWDAFSGKMQRKFKGHDGGVSSVAISSDGLRVLTGSYDGTARLWDAARGKLQREFKGHVRAVTSVAFSPDGRNVLTGNDDKTARLWDIASGQVQREFRGYGSRVTSVAFSPDGQQIALGTNDCAYVIALNNNGVGFPETRVFVHGEYAPSTALFDSEGNLLDCDNEAADTWLMCLARGKPEPIEFAPVLALPA
jgi:WD40 repeat protein